VFPKQPPRRPLFDYHRYKDPQNKDHGRLTKYEHQYEGYNYRMAEIQAAVLNVKFKYLKTWTDRRQEIAQYYDRQLSDGNVLTPDTESDVKHVYHLYVIRVQERADLKNALAHEGIATGIHYPAPLHLQKAYKYLGHRKGDFPVAERLSEEILSIPIFPELTWKEIDKIITVIKKHCGQKSFKVSQNV